MHIEAWSGLWFAWTLPAIALLYLLKRKYIDTEVSSHLLWQQALREMEANRPWQKLRRNLLLLLQLLIAALLVLALLRPYVYANHKGPAHLVLVLDRSASMLAYADGAAPEPPQAEQARAGGAETAQGARTAAGQQPETRLEQAKRKLLSAVKDAARGSRFTLIVTGKEPEVLVSGETSPDAVEAALRRVTPFAGRTAYKETLSLADSLLRDDPQAELRFYTDGQWADDTNGLRLSRQPVVDEVPAQQNDNVSIMQFGVKAASAAADSVPMQGNGADNAAAGSVPAQGNAADSAPNSAGKPSGSASVPDGSNFAAPGRANVPSAVPGGTNAVGGVASAVKGGMTGVATVKNWGAAEAVVELSVYAGERLAGVQQVRLQSGEQTSVYFDRLGQADYYRLKLDVLDRLAWDNEAYAFPAQNRARTALLVSEGNLFLEKALKITGTDVIKAQKNENDGFYVLPESRVDFVVLDGIRPQDVATPQWQSLLASRPVWYIGAAGGGDKTAVPASDYAIEDHPVMQYVKFQDVHIAEAYRPLSVGWGKPVASAGAVPLVYAGTEQGQPRLLFAFDLHASDLPLRPDFPILVQNAADWLAASAAASLGRAVAGETMDIALSARTVQAAWIPVAKGDSAADSDRLAGSGPSASKEGAAGSDPAAPQAAQSDSGLGAPQVAQSASGVRIPKAGLAGGAQTVPDEPGLYRLVEKDESGRIVQTRYLEVVMDPREANLAYRPELRFQAGTSPEQAAGAPPAGPSGMPPGTPSGAPSSDTSAAPPDVPPSTPGAPSGTPPSTSAAPPNASPDTPTAPPGGSSSAPPGTSSSDSPAAPSVTPPGGSSSGSAADLAGRSPYPLTNWLAWLVILLLALEWGVYRRGHPM